MQFGASTVTEVCATGSIRMIPSLSMCDGTLIVLL